MAHTTQPYSRIATPRRSTLAAAQSVLLLFGLLLPLNVPFSLPDVGGETLLGWSSRPIAPDRQVVTHTMRHAHMAGLLPGDVVIEVNGAAADSARLERIRRESRPGDELRLLVRREGRLQSVRVPVAANSKSYSGYFWYRVAVALAAWFVGMALLAWRGDRAPALALGAALLLYAPITLPSGVPAENGFLDVARIGWQMQAAAHRFFFPALLTHFLVLHDRTTRRLRAPLLWAGIYLALAAVLGVVTDFLRDPMLWAQLGPRRQLRTIVGFAFEVAAIAMGVRVWRRVRNWSSPLQWVTFAILMVVGTGALLSLTLILFGERRGLEFLWRTNGLTLLLLPPAAALYLFLHRTSRTDGQDRSRIALSASWLLTGLYGFAVAGAAAVVLSSAGRDLGGIEWLLFVVIFLATIIFAPVLRWARDMVDRRVFAQWKEREAGVRSFVDRIGAELEPGRAARRIAQELPTLLHVTEAELVLVEELVERWDWGDEDGVACLARHRLADRVATRALDRSGGLVPVSRPQGELLGAIRLGARTSERGYEPSERALLPAIAQGAATAVRNAENYSRLRQAQQELADAERIASMGALAAGLAHEIKNPLAGLKMGLYLLEQRSRSGPNGETFARIERDVRRIDDLVSGLLRFTRADRDESTAPVALRPVVETCIANVRPLAADRAARLVEYYPSEPIHVLANAKQIRLVVSNLLRNAVDAVGEDDRIEVAVEASDAEVEITVRDTGPGVPAGSHDRVFELNFSDKPGGTGLGLALARREVDRLGGRIELESLEGEGTLLRVTLPRITL